MAVQAPNSEAEQIRRATAELLGGVKVLQLKRPPAGQIEVHELLRHGLPARSLASLTEALSSLGYTETYLAKALGISERTVQRRKRMLVKRLSLQQSGRMWKFAEILSKATAVFGSRREAAEWLRRPASGLEQRCPIDLLVTPAGAELVENFLERLEYGVYA